MRLTALTAHEYHWGYKPNDAVSSRTCRVQLDTKNAISNFINLISKLTVHCVVCSKREWALHVQTISKLWIISGGSWYTHPSLNANQILQC
jgi:hypothetical protein